MLVIKERSWSGINQCYLCLLFADPFSGVAGKQEHWDYQDIVIPSQPFIMKNLLKAETTVTPTRKAFSPSIRKGSLAPCQPQKAYVSSKLKCYVIILLPINRSFQNSFIQLLIAGRSKEMKGQQVWREHGQALKVKTHKFSSQENIKLRFCLLCKPRYMTPRSIKIQFWEVKQSSNLEDFFAYKN